MERHGIERVPAPPVVIIMRWCVPQLFKGMEPWTLPHVYVHTQCTLLLLIIMADGLRVSDHLCTAYTARSHLRACSAITGALLTSASVPTAGMRPLMGMVRWITATAGAVVNPGT